MLLYIFVVVFPLLVGYFYQQGIASRAKQEINEAKQKRIRFWYLFFAALPMFFLIAFRHRYMGADTGMYLENFKVIVSTPWEELKDSSRMEYGYLVFVKLITYITENPLVFQIIYSSVYLFSVTWFANELEGENFLFLYLFGTLGMYTFMFTGVRQCLAICICLLSYRTVKNRKFIRFALFMLLAFYFHKSSILFAVTYFIYTRKLNIINVFAYIVGTALVALNLEAVQAWLNAQLDYDYEIESNTGGYIFAAVMLVITVFTIFTIVSNKALNKHSQGLINIAIIALVFWIIRIFTRVAERPSYYFLPFSFAALTYAIASMKALKEKGIMNLLVFLLPLILFIYRLMTNFASLIPYTFYSA